MKVDRYILKFNSLSKRPLYRLIKEGNKKASITFNNGIAMQQYIGWLVLNRECSIDYRSYSGLQKGYIIASSNQDKKDLVNIYKDNLNELSISSKRKQRFGVVSNVNN